MPAFVKVERNLSKCRLVGISDRGKSAGQRVQKEGEIF